MKLKVIGASIILLLILGFLFTIFYHKNFTLVKIDEVSCHPFWSNISSSTQELVINTQEDYQKLLQYKNQSCSIQLPAVDFERSTILGKYAIGSCAVYGFDRKYSRDDENRIVNYSVSPKKLFYITHCSGKGIYSLNLIQIPKIPSDYKINFFPAIKN